MAPDIPPTPLSSAKTVRPFVVVVSALFAQTCAGTIYWWPAIMPALSHHLGFSAAQTAALVATANSGSTLGFLGGFFHARFGSRTTAAVGAGTLSLCFASLSLLASSAAPESPAKVNVAFVAALLLSILVVTFSYMVYSSSMTASVTVFPSRFRGRVVGLNSAMFGGTAAVFACVQAAFFPRLSDAADMLLFVALLCLSTVVLVLTTFPGNARGVVKYEIDVGSVPPEEAPLVGAGDMPQQYEHVTRHVSDRLSALYSHAWIFVAALQAGALADNLGAPHAVLVALAVLVVCTLLGTLAVPAKTRVRAYSVAAGADGDAGADSEEPGFGEVARDQRYQLLCLGALVLVAGGGISLLVQAPAIVETWGHADDTADKEAVARRLAAGVRALVSLFAACNITARLGGGAIMDWGASDVERTLWKFNIFQANALVMGAGLLLLGTGVRVVGLVGVALVGAAYGSYFAVAPALTAVWFGVRAFPLNFAVIGPFVAIGTATLSSVVPGWLRATFGTWRVVGGDGDGGLTTRCTAVSCVLPSMAMLAGLQGVLYAAGRLVWPMVRREAAVGR